MKIFLKTYCILSMILFPSLIYNNIYLYKINNKTIHVINELSLILENLCDEIEDSGFEEYLVARVNASGYTACEEECDKTPNKTAIMTTPIPGKTAAVSRDLKHLLGKKIYIEGLGIRQVEDLMNKRYKNSIDVLFVNKNEAKEFGRKQIPLIVCSTN